MYRVVLHRRAGGWLCEAAFASTSARQSSRARSTMSKTRLLGEDGHTATVVWLHGLGDTPAGWFPACREMHAKLKAKGHSVKFVLPEAPVQPVSCNGGYVPFTHACRPVLQLRFTVLVRAACVRVPLNIWRLYLYTLVHVLGLLTRLQHVCCSS